MSALAPLKYLVVPALKKHTATVVFIHGLGDSGHGMEPIARMVGQHPQLQHVKWVLPHAEIRSVTANMGMEMPSWYDITSFDFLKREEDEQGMLQSSRLIGDIIAAEVDSGIPSERVVLGGFSQGGALTLLGGLTAERKLGGLLVCSSYLPLSSKLKSMMSDHARNLRIFWGHGEQDPLINIGLCEISTNALVQELGIGESNLTVKRYPGLQHSINGEEMRDMATWLQSVLPDGN